MSALTTLDDLEQGTDEWLAARRGLLTASVVGQLITSRTLRLADNDASRGLIRQLAAERITGRVEDAGQSRAMLRGELDEPLARAAYENLRGVTVREVGLMVRDLGGGVRLGYSPDGLVGDDGLIEIKSRNPREQIRCHIEGTVPPANVAQLQAGLLVSGRPWIDYVSYCGGTPLCVLRVTPDPRWQAVLVEAATAAEEQITALITAYQAHTDGLPVTPFIDHFDTEITF